MVRIPARNVGVMEDTTYQAPTITNLGSVSELTQQGADGAKFDFSFASGEPVPLAFRGS